jgi:hypothetical protein
MHTPLCRREGAILAETLVAAALLTVAMGFLVEFATQGLTESVLTQRRTRGALLAQEKMEEILAARADLEAWEAQAQEVYPEDPDGPHRLFAAEGLEEFRWGWNVLQPEGRPRMREAVVRVYWRFPRRKHFFRGCQIRTLLATPPSATKGGAR